PQQTGDGHLAERRPLEQHPQRLAGATSTDAAALVQPGHRLMEGLEVGRIPRHLEPSQVEQIAERMITPPQLLTEETELVDDGGRLERDREQLLPQHCDL